VLIRAGGVLEGVMALVTVVVIASHECCDSIFTWNVCRLVPGTVVNVQAIGPDVVASPSRSTVTVPVHRPVKNDCGAVGALGDESRPHAPTNTKKIPA